MEILVNGEIILYGVVGETWWTDEYFTAADVMKAVAELKHEARITVRVNSGGGSAFDGLAIHNILKASPAFIDLHVDGIAASAMSIICMGADQVTMNTGTSMMIHDAANGTYGDPAAHEKAAKILHKISDQCANAYAEKTESYDAEQIREWMRDETWFNPQEAFAAGLIDHIGDGEAIAASLFDYSAYNHAPPELRAMAEAQASIFQKNEKTPSNNLQERTKGMPQKVKEGAPSNNGNEQQVATDEQQESVKNDAVDADSIRREERTRIQNIFFHGVENKCPNMASRLAFETNQSVDEAKASMEMAKLDKPETGSNSQSLQQQNNAPQLTEGLELMGDAEAEQKTPVNRTNEIYQKLNAR